MFSVRWERKALDIAAINWFGGKPEMRAQIQTAFAAIGRRLQEDPLNVGDSRADNDRFTFVPPFAVYFRVDTETKVVSVLPARFYKPQSQS